MPELRPPGLCRSWLFLEGANEPVLKRSFKRRGCSDPGTGRLGYSARSLVDSVHAAVINRLLTPGDDDMRRARQIVTAFDAARAKGQARVELDGSLVEVPTYANAKRLLARGEALRQFERAS